MSGIDSRWLRARDRTSLILLLRCAADVLVAGKANPDLGGSVTAAQRALGLPPGHMIVAYRLMKHAAGLWRNLDLSNERNVDHLGVARVADIHIWAALFAAQRLEEGNWP